MIKYRWVSIILNIADSFIWSEAHCSLSVIECVALSFNRAFVKPNKSQYITATGGILVLWC